MLGSVGIFQKMPQELHNNPEVNAQCWETSEDDRKREVRTKGRKRKERRQKEEMYLLDLLTFLCCLAFSNY